MPSLSVRFALSFALAAACSSGSAMATIAPPVTLAGLTGSAGRIFRGVCLNAEPGPVEVAGARIAATTYTFEVREYLKGGGGPKVIFRQVGTPGGGPGDLGRAAGLPVYSPGLEYVIFLLPESKAHLTSPAGASRGALLVKGEEVIVPGGLAGLPSTALRGGSMSYLAVRDAVLGALGGRPPARP